MSQPFTHENPPSPREWLILASAAIRRWGELVLEEIERDLAAMGSLDEFSQAYLAAYWSQLADDVLHSSLGKISVPPATVENLEKQSEVIEQRFGISLDETRPAPVLKQDVAERLAKLKTRLADAFERNVLNTITVHGISSPIEQIFLMEWRFSRVEERFRLKLQPQQSIRTEDGVFNLDFCVTPIDDPKTRFSVAIELDGHEFHEKTPEQVREDKRRERAIIRAGVPNGLVVLRFSGSEIVRDCAACVREIIDYIEQRHLA